MRACAGSALVVLTVAVSSACQTTRPSGLHPDVVVLWLLLDAGDREAHMQALHPHRHRDDAAPEISAILDGPGWTARFSGTERGACDDNLNLDFYPGTCLRASFPEPIRPGSEYRLRGTAPLGSFTAEITSLTTPILLEPADTLRLPLPAETGYVRIPLRYRVDTETGQLLADLAVTDSGARTRRSSVPVGIAGVDTIRVFQRGSPLTISLQLRGIGRNYVNFTNHTGHLDLVVPPWPSFGIEGEGVYGLFDSLVDPSRTVVILVGETS